jgi:hypothetical protein
MVWHGDDGATGRQGLPLMLTDAGGIGMTSGLEKQETSTTVDPAREFLEFWKHYFDQTAIQTRILLESTQSAKSLEQLQNQWLGTLSEGLESFMRTPAFLEVLKQSLKRMIDLKLAQDQLVQSVAQQSGLPLSSDVSGVFERVKSAEELILTRLTAIENRLQAIEAKLHANRTERKTSRRSEP